MSKTYNDLNVEQLLRRILINTDKIYQKVEEMQDDTYSSKDFLDTINSNLELIEQKIEDKPDEITWSPKVKEAIKEVAKILDNEK